MGHSHSQSREVCLQYLALLVVCIIVNTDRLAKNELTFFICTDTYIRERKLLPLLVVAACVYSRILMSFSLQTANIFASFCNYYTLILQLSLVGSTDFANGQYSFTIQPNEQETTVRIPITDDQVVEQLREQFSVSLSLQPQSGLNTGNSQASVTIVDDDGEISIHVSIYKDLFSLEY